MNVVIIGAGASYGAGAAEPDVPPLTPELMPALAAAAPLTWGRLPEKLQLLFRDDFEVGMTHLAVSRPDLFGPLQRAMAQFFFGFQPGPTSLYRELARRIAETEWDGAFVSLNYERLLQLSLEAEGVRPMVGVSGDPGSTVEVCLPHGCCHLFCKGVEAVATGVEFAGLGVATGGIIEVVDDPEEFSRRIEGNNFPPVMSYFNPAKDTTSCVNFIMKQRARYRELVGSASHVAIVGVAVRPHDRHLWDPLTDSPADIAFCAGEAAGEAFLKWTAENRPACTNQAYPTYFSESFDQICEAVRL